MRRACFSRDLAYGGLARGEENSSSTRESEREERANLWPSRVYISGGGDGMRRERQFTVNWIIRDRVSPTSRTLNSFPISRFETNLKSRQQTSQNENLSEKRNLLFIYLLFCRKTEMLDGERRLRQGLCTPAHPLHRPTKERKRTSASKGRANTATR